MPYQDGIKKPGARLTSLFADISSAKVEWRPLRPRLAPCPMAARDRHYVSFPGRHRPAFALSILCHTPLKPGAAGLLPSFPPRRGQDHADRKAAAVLGRDPDRGRRQGPQGQPPCHLRLDGNRKAARHLGGQLGHADELPRSRGQPARHARPLGLLGRHLPRATAVDSALMVIDAANGVESQTRRLIEVCRQRDTPIITFVNKMDREVRDPLDILDEVEREPGMPCCPVTWPVGQGRQFGGIINLLTQTMTVFQPGSERPPGRTSRPSPGRGRQAARALRPVLRRCAGKHGTGPGRLGPWDHEAFLAGKLTPVFFGSGVNNFGVMEVLDAVVDMSPPPGPAKLAAGQQAACGKDHPARGRRLLRRGLQGPGQHGCQPPRPHRLRARGLGRTHPA
ncbi:Elongation factor G, mitochondrial [Manis javanica]|nr:Elongation factor G, mitochondrial [Manis javanica]